MIAGAEEETNRKLVRRRTVAELRVSLQVHQFGNRGAVDVGVQQADGLELRGAEIRGIKTEGFKCFRQLLATIQMMK